MTVTIKQLRAVVALGSTGSFRSAAEATHVSPPALSIAIAQLETELGVRLFDRTSRRVSASDVGKRFIENARRVLDDLDSMMLDVGDAAAAKSGIVTIASIASVAARVLPLAIQRIAESFPGIEVRLIDDVGSKVMSAVRARHADFGLMTAPESVGNDMVFEDLHRDPFYLAFRRDHRLSQKRTVTWRDIRTDRLIGLSDSTASSTIVERVLRDQSIRPASTFIVSNLSVAHGLLEANFGVCFMPEIALPALSQSNVAAILLTKPRAWRTIVACHLQTRSLSPVSQAALGIVREVFQECHWQQR